jgi:hypothetical protein
MVATRIVNWNKDGNASEEQLLNLTNALRFAVKVIILELFLVMMETF